MFREHKMKWKKIYYCHYHYAIIGIFHVTKSEGIRFLCKEIFNQVISIHIIYSNIHISFIYVYLAFANI